MRQVSQVNRLGFPDPRPNQLRLPSFHRSRGTEQTSAQLGFIHKWVRPGAGWDAGLGARCWLPPTSGPPPGEGEVLLECGHLQAHSPRKRLFPTFPCPPTPATDRPLFPTALAPPLQTATLGAQGQNPTGTLDFISAFLYSKTATTRHFLCTRQSCTVKSQVPPAALGRVQDSISILQGSPALNRSAKAHLSSSHFSHLLHGDKSSRRGHGWSLPPCGTPQGTRHKPHSQWSSPTCHGDKWPSIRGRGKGRTSSPIPTSTWTNRSHDTPRAQGDSGGFWQPRESGSQLPTRASPRGGHVGVRQLCTWQEGHSSPPMTHPS